MNKWLKIFLGIYAVGFVLAWLLASKSGARLKVSALWPVHLFNVLLYRSQWTNIGGGIDASPEFAEWLKKNP